MATYEFYASSGTTSWLLVRDNSLGTTFAICKAVGKASSSNISTLEGDLVVEGYPNWRVLWRAGGYTWYAPLTYIGSTTEPHGSLWADHIQGDGDYIIVAVNGSSYKFDGA